MRKILILLLLNLFIAGGGLSVDAMKSGAKMLGEIELVKPADEGGKLIDFIKSCTFEEFLESFKNIPKAKLHQIYRGDFNLMQLVAMYGSNTIIMSFLQGKGFNRYIENTQHGNLLELAVTYNNNFEMAQFLVNCYKLKPTRARSWESLVEKARTINSDNIDVLLYLTDLAMAGGPEKLESLKKLLASDATLREKMEAIYT